MSNRELKNNDISANVFLKDVQNLLVSLRPLNSLLRGVALNCMAELTRYPLYKPKGTDNAGF